MSAYQYSVVRFVPDPVRGESVNVGVVVAGEDPQFFGSRFLDPRRSGRVRKLALTDDLSFINDLAIEMRPPDESGPEQPSLEPLRAWTLSDLEKAAAEWGNTIQFSELRPALHEKPEQFVDELFQRYVANPRPKGSRARSKRWVRRRVTTALGEALAESLPDADPSEVLRHDVSVVGKFETHEFDYSLRDHGLNSLVQTLAVEGANEKGSKREVDALAWAIDDVRMSDKSVSIDVVAIGKARILEAAERVYEGLDAAIVREEDIETWAQGVVSPVTAEEAT
jgi:hypothetical protein